MNSSGSNTGRKRRDERRFYLFVLPWILGFILFQAGPMLIAIGLSFTDWFLVDTPTWRGVDHYQTLVHDNLFWLSLRNSAYYTAVVVPVGVLFAFFLAVLLNRNWIGMGFFRTIFFMPALVSGVAIVMVWGWLFNPRFGAVNAVLRAVGLPEPGWLGDPRWAMPVIILLGLWSVGGSMLIYIAGLQNIPQELYDAAKMDGAGRWAVTWHVTFPMISSITFFLLIVATIGSLQVFTPMYVLTEGGPKNSTLTLPLYIYQNAFLWQKFGYAAALTVVLIVVTLLLTGVQLLMAKRWVYYGGMGAR